VSDRFQVLRLDEVEGYAEDGRPRWHMIRSMLGIESFGINAWRATEIGQEIIGEHDEIGPGAGGHEELYLVLAGHATFTLDGETVLAPVGSMVFVKDPATKRKAVANEVGTRILVVGGRPGAPFAVSPWERSAEALRYWTTGDWDRAIDVLRVQLAQDPHNANLFYNLACAESRGGYPGLAVDHLRRAIELEPKFAQLALEDDDLEPIRGYEGFPG